MTSVPESLHKHAESQDTHESYLQRVGMDLPEITFCGCVDGFEVLGRFVLLAIEEFDRVDGDDGVVGDLGGLV